MLDQFLLPIDVAKQIATNEKLKRRKRKISQNDLSAMTGVSVGSIKRFEQTGEISLLSLLKIADALDEMDEFKELFTKKEYASIQEVIDENS